MECFICGTGLEYYFSKTYNEEPFATHMGAIGKVDYHRCPHCGFTASKTHCELDSKAWEKLNFDYHTFSESAKKTKQSKGNPPPYLDQSFMIKVLSENGVIDAESMLDFAGGYGTLSNALSKYFGLHLPVYDPYVQKNNREVYLPKESLGVYETLINSALFEHVTSRADLDEINALVSDSGCMIIHTVICENVPADPDWFYIRIPVHCAFHTNKSMQLLMDQWGYKSSVYCPSSKCWVLFREEKCALGTVVDGINNEFQSEYLIYKDGFVDYWKGFC